jgi:GTPase
MPKLPTVAIIGRPNTGKSTLFNRFLGYRKAIVHDVPGTTRDPIVSRIEGESLDYLLMDTGGMGGGTEDKDFEDDVEAQSLLSLSYADLILFVVNGREALTAADHNIVNFLRKKRRKHVFVFMVISKCDDVHKMEEALPQFYELGIADETFAISATHGLGVDALKEGIEGKLKEMHFGKESSSFDPNGASEDRKETEDVQMPRVALVGRPNVGKSSLMNALMSEKERKARPRMTSDVPGTTRDTTDTVIRSEGKGFLFLDTAGLRKHAHTDADIEAFAVLRTLQAIESADVTVLVIDATQEIGRQDKRIANLAIERGTGLIILINKNDLLTTEQQQLFARELMDTFAFCRWAPIIFTSAETRENLPKLFGLIATVCENRKRRIETSVINRWFQDVVAQHQPIEIGGKSLSAKYITQVDISPPTFALFLKNPERLNFSTLRFMEKKMRSTFAFDGSPMRWVKKGST